MIPPSHKEKPVKKTIEVINWEILSRAAYSPDSTPTEYYSFALMGQVLLMKMSKNGSMIGVSEEHVF